MLPLKRPAIALKRRTREDHARHISQLHSHILMGAGQAGGGGARGGGRAGAAGAEYDTAAIEAEARLQLAELVDNTPRNTPRTED